MIIALDTETTLIPDRAHTLSRSGQKINLSPYETPEFIIGSSAYIGPCMCTGLGMLPEFPRSVRRMLENGDELVFHNAAFDIDVLCKADPSLWPLFQAALDAGRIHDTMILDVLYGLAIGRYDKPYLFKDSGKYGKLELRFQSLDKLAKYYCDMDLPKDPNIRLGFGQFKGWSFQKIPTAYTDYAVRDAEATLSVYIELRRRIHDELKDSDLSEPLQVKASIAMHAMDKRGVEVDKGLATKLYHIMADMQKPLQEQMVEEGLGRWMPTPNTTKVSKVAKCDGSTDWVKQGKLIVKYRHYKTRSDRRTATPRFQLNTKQIQKALPKVEGAPVRADGSPGLDADFWSKHISRRPSPLRTWLRHEGVKKVCNTYLHLYSRTDRVFPRWHVLGARSGRMSAARPSIQNVPKRKTGIRALFMTQPGHQLVVADYSGMEMFTLCEIMHKYNVKGPLYDILSGGADIHTHSASLVLGKPMAEVTKVERQGQKVLNFGIPGGLGPAKLADYAYGMYGLDWDEKEAAKRRDKFFQTFTDIEAYLNCFRKGQTYCLQKVTGEGVAHWRSKLGGNCGWNVIRALSESDDPALKEVGLEAERQVKVTLPSGRIRARCRFTEAANTGFQGLAADVTKEALWRAHCAGLPVVIVVHDEIVLESKEEDVEKHVDLLRECMLGAFRDLCPLVGSYATVDIQQGLSRWGKVTDLEGKELDMEALIG
jgi:DNA polymerase I-like protein with 3'-5' exonuclease and polymerase domains